MQRAREGDEEKKRAQKAEILSRVWQADFPDLFLDARDNDLQQILPAGTGQTRGKFARDQLGTHGEHEHQSPREHDGAVEFEKPVLPENHLVGAKAHGSPPVLCERWPRQRHHHQAGQDKSDETRYQTLPISVANEIETNEDDGHPHQQTTQKPQGRMGG